MKIDKKGLAALLLASAFGVSCAQTDDLGEVEISEKSQALAAISLEHMAMASTSSTLANYAAYHKVRYLDGSWSPYAPPGTPQIRYNKVEGSMVARDAHYVQYGQTLYHNIRYANGNWVPQGWGLVPNAFNFPNWAYADVGMAEIGNDLHICSVGRANGNTSHGVILHQVRYGNGSWSQTGNVPTGITGAQTVDCVGHDGNLVVVYSHNTDIFSITRDPTGNWTQPFRLSPLLGYSNGPIALTTVNLTGQPPAMHVTVIKGGVLHHRAITIFGATDWAVIPGQNGKYFSDVSSADVLGSLHVMGLANNRAQHTIRRIDGSWELEVRALPSLTGNRPIVSVTAAGSSAVKP